MTPNSIISAMSKQSKRDSERKDILSNFETNEDPDGDESRNNLYWLNSQNLPCLWYSGSKCQSPEDIISVIPIICTPNNRKKQFIKVARKYLVPLDEDLLALNCKHTYTRNFSYALLDFAEYDDAARDSYFWPSFILELIKHADLCILWIHRVLENSLNVKLEEQRRLFLFYMCAQHVGILNHDLEFVNFKEIDRDVRDLFEKIASINDKDDITKDFRRSSSRVGDEYQVNYNNQIRNENMIESADNNGNNCLVYQQSRLTEEELNEYITLVHNLRIRHISPGQLIEAPSYAISMSGLMSTNYQHLHLSGQKLNESDLKKSFSQGRKPGRRNIACFVVGKRKIIDDSTVNPFENIFSLNLSSSSSSGSKSRLILEVDVFDGNHTWTVPAKSCRILTMPEDQALTILHNHKYNVATSIKYVEAELVICRVLYSKEWTLKSFDYFIKTSDRYGENIQLIKDKFNSYIERCRTDSSLYEDTIEPNDMLDFETVHSQLLDNLDTISSSSSTSTSSMIDSGKMNNLSSLLFEEVKEETTISDPPKLKTMKEIVSLYFQVFQGKRDVIIPLSSRLNADIGIGGKSQRRSDSLLDTNNSSVVIKRPRRVLESDSVLPQRWPNSLPFAHHNMYWIRNNNSPCVCLGFNPSIKKGEGFLRVITLCCSTYHHEVSVSASALEPLSNQNMKTCPDDRSVDFALAMVDFSEWELSNRPANSKPCRWYEYPTFIRNFLAHAPTWKTWRAQAERAARGKKDDKRKIYFESLVDECLKQDEIRIFSEIYPWDDSVSYCSSDDDKENLNEIASEAPEIIDISKNIIKKESTSNNEKIVNVSIIKEISAVIKKPKGDSKKSNRISIIPTIPVLPPVPIKTVRKRNVLNMYWMPRATLPCLYYDTYELEGSEKFSVLPVCCTTYHYAVDTMTSFIEPLTTSNLRSCTDERTHDFALALMGFATWHKNLLKDFSSSESEDDQRHYISLLNSQDLGSAEAVAIGVMNNEIAVELVNIGSEDEKAFYQFPDFILDLICNPREWASWRKKVERTISTKNPCRKHSYYKALCEGLLLNPTT
jgi:hypothetical protein